MVVAAEVSRLPTTWEGGGGKGGNRTTKLASKGNMKSQPRPALSTTLPSKINT